MRNEIKEEVEESKYGLTAEEDITTTYKFPIHI